MIQEMSDALQGTTMANALRFGRAVHSTIDPFVHCGKDVSFRLADTYNFRNFVCLVVTQPEVLAG